MTLSDAAKIIFGAAIGLIISMLQNWFAFKKSQNRSERLLRVQIPRLLLYMESLKKFYVAHKGVNSTELPSLNFFGGTELAALPEHLAKQVLDLDDSIKRAEMCRKMATSNLDRQESPEFLVHQMAYGEYIQNAVDRLNTIQKHLQCPKTNSNVNLGFPNRR
jgi:hypothetical protein